jgi:hypothetical protein
VDLTKATRAKKGLPEEDERGTFWRGTALETDTRLRVGRALAKTEEEVAQKLREQIKDRGHQDAPPGIATDGKGAYREALVETWGKVPEPKPSGKGFKPEKKQPQPGWHSLQVVKQRAGGRVVEVKVEVVYGDETTLALVGAHTSYVERTNLTARQMNGRLVRKTLSFSKELEMLKASSVWEDAAYNLTREVKTLRIKVEEEKRRFAPRTPAMAAGLTDHIWSIKELLWTVVSPIQSTQNG